MLGLEILPGAYREITQPRSFLIDGVCPWERIPILKIFALAHTQTSMNPVVKTTASAISHQGGPGGMAILSIINIGVAGGKRETTREKVLDGAWRTGIQVNMGIIINIMAGNIIFWASRSSLHAAPIAEKIEPKIMSASN